MKPQRTIVTLDGIFVRNPVTGFYEPENQEERNAHPGLIIAALCLLGWAAFAGLAYCLWMAARALT